MAHVPRLPRSVALLAALVALAAPAVGAPTAGAVACTGDAVSITTANDLVEFSNCASYSGLGIVTLAQDIDLATETSPQSFRPIGTLSGPFVGTFDGNNRTISGLNVGTPTSDYVGLFGYAGHADRDAVIKNLTLASPQVTGRYYAGALAGVLYGGRIQNVDVANAQVSSTQWGGLLAGWLRSYRPITVRDVRTQGAVTVSDTYAGGLFGQVYAQSSTVPITIERVSAVGSATADGRVGGLAGEIAFAVSDVAVTVEDAGLRVTLARNADAVSSYFGGAFGTIADTTSSLTGNSVSLTRLYAAGAIPNFGRGGVVGYAAATAAVGGTAGTVLWDTETTGAAAAATGPAAAAVAAVADGRTTAQMTALATYTASPAWPIVSPWQAPATGRSWGLCASVNAGYPFLLGANATTPCAAPGAPTLDSVTRTGRTGITAAFTAGAAGDAPITGYESSIDNGASWQPADPATTTGPVVISGLTPGALNQVRVRAVSAVGVGTASNMLPAYAAACVGANGQLLEEAGSVDDPYLIGSVADLRAVATGTCFPERSYLQTADIELPAPTGGATANLEPIGSSSNPFAGRYDGAGHVISNLVNRNASATAPVGLFGTVVYHAKVRRVHVRGVDLVGGAEVGALIGSLDADGGYLEVADVSATGTVSGTNRVGGLIGNARAPSAPSSVYVTSAEADVAVTAAGASAVADAGGLIGRLAVINGAVAEVTDAAASGAVMSGTGPVSGGRSVGGLIGMVDLSVTGAPPPTNPVKVADAVARGAVGGPQRVGGLIGAVASASAARSVLLQRVAATGAVTAGDQGGGLVGRIEGASATGGGGVVALADAYARGAVTRYDGAAGTGFGGAVGWFGQASGKFGELGLDRVYATGAVPVGNGVVGTHADGALNTGSGFWDTETTGQSASGLSAFNLEGKTTAQMRAIGLYLDLLSPWPIVPLWQAPATGRTWGLCASVNGGYPFLLMEHAAMPCAAPAAPTALTATAGDGSARIAFTAGAAGDAAISGYEASVDGGAWTALSGTTSPLAVTGLVNGRSHAIRLRALSAVGAGAASEAVAVTPTAVTGTLKRTRFTAIAGARVRVRATVTGPGRVVVTGTRVGATARAKARPLCSARATVKKAGTVTLFCALNRAARAQLARAPLRLRITAAYTPTGGTATTMAQVFTLPRATRG